MWPSFDQTLLVLWSGGLDSTAALYQVLKTTDRDVLAVWMDYHTREGRRDAESRAVQALLPRLQMIRPFRFMTVGQDFAALGHTPVDLHVYSFVAAQIARGTGIRRIASGLMAEDKDPGWAERRHVANAILDACFADRPDQKPQWEFPVEHMTKEDEIRLIGRDLYDLTWSCRWPVNTSLGPRRCNECPTCKRLIAAEMAIGINR